ncbi:hypothetical protein ACN38_g12751, partial [Penicillium nordicum]
TFEGLRGPAQTYQWPARYMGPIHMISLRLRTLRN